MTKKKSPLWEKIFMVHSRGFEPLTLGSEDQCSIQLSYECASYVIYPISIFVKSKTLNSYLLRKGVLPLMLKHMETPRPQETSKIYKLGIYTVNLEDATVVRTDRGSTAVYSITNC